ncbi:hypothetical protein VTL71DRAFT_7721 [Oculimacula yallundae]|uniref:Nitrate reductase [NADPH] n=1 Tax=Oculimacula yallundae TaxID=86028 RepID=A0ABR4BXI8_9HELO
MNSRGLFGKLFRVTARIYKANITSSASTRKSSISSFFTRATSRRIAPKPRRRIFVAAFTGSSVLAVGLVTNPQPFRNEQNKDSEQSDLKSGFQKFRLAEIELHHGASERPWVTRGNSVYDITGWVAAHPGGDVILHAAGGSIDSYWNIFTIHKRQDVYDILEQYKIGEVEEADLVDGKVPTKSIRDPFMTDPVLDNRLQILTARPCNAETPAEALSDFCTPNETFYVRNHMWVPAIDQCTHRLLVELSDGTERSYTIQELKSRFRQHTVTATLQCAGNRRKDMTKHARQTNGLQWSAGAISTAEWKGCKLRDVLADAGLNFDNLSPSDNHTQFLGSEAYGASIPLRKAIDPFGDVILAFQMNGVDLPPEHGFPLRVVVPGNVAARSVKWLRKIVISDEESVTQWQRKDYKSFGPNVSKPNWETAKSIQEMPVTSAITSILNSPCVALEGVKCKNAHMKVEGYAYSGGGREIVRVDISADGGATWDQAELLDDVSSGSKAWCWKRWRYTLGDRSVGRASLMVKATDEAYNTQPQSYESIYNARGNLATAWHRVDVEQGTARGTVRD